MLAGALAAFIGNPADLALVRMQADATLPIENRRHYKHVGDALIRIVREEGVLNLWKGAFPTILRASVLNTILFTTYDTTQEVAKSILSPDSSRSKIQLLASFCAAAGTTTGSLPFDNIKIKIQKQKAGPDGILPYKGVSDCISKTIVREGVTGLWSGFLPQLLKQGP